MASKTKESSIVGKATKTKESSIVGKEKKVPSSSSHITSTKRTTKPSTTINSTNKAKSTSSTKSIPNYLKPTKSSRLESLSFKQPKNEPPNNKPSSNRRKTLDKTLTSSSLTKKIQPSNSRLQKPLLSSGPRESPLSFRSSIVPINKNKSTNLSKPILNRASKPPSDGKTKPLVAKIKKKNTPSLSTSTSIKKVANNDHAPSPNSKKRIAEETIETSSVVSEHVKEVTSQEVEVIKVENERDKHEIEHVTDISPDVEVVHDIVYAHELENFDPPQDQVDEERIISTVSEAEEAEKELQEEKTKHEEHELEETSTNQDEGNNNENDHQEEHFVAEGEVAVNEKEDKDEGEGEGGLIVIEDHKSENNNEEEIVEAEKEEVEEVKVEPTQSNQNLGANEQRNKESQISNDVIEEATSKLLEERKNKVRALAGAFQTVIDHQTTSK